MKQSAFVPWRRAELEQSVADRFRQVAMRYGPRLALKDGPVSLSYEQLDRASNDLAQQILERRGPQPEPIALLMTHGAGIIVAIMAAVKAGKIYLALEPSHPAPVLAQVLAEARPALLMADLAHEALAETISSAQTPLMTASHLATTSAAPDPRLALSPDTLFSLTFTSGSTGRPKGVLHDHRNLLHVAYTVSNRLEITPDDRHTHLLSSSFGGSVSNIFGALLNGASLFPFDLKREGLQATARWLQAEQITVYHTVPTIFRHLLRTLQPDEQFPHMRVVKLGGERVLKHDIDLFRRHFAPDCLMQATLGTSEAHIVCWTLLRAGGAFDHPVVPAGYAEEDAEILIVNENGRPFEPGAGDAADAGSAVGEIVVRSRYLFNGYWRNPQQTAAAFAQELTDGDRRAYRTGDLGRLAAGGLLEHMGRKDFQVKIRGQRVDLAVVEAAIMDIPDIRDVAVVARTTTTGETRLVAYVVSSEHAAPVAGRLRRALAPRLPQYAIPTYFVAMERLPLLGFGKVNHRALPEPDWERPELEVSYVAPRDELEARLAQAWAEALGVSRVGIHDNFFELGGHSLLATQLVSHIREQLQIDLALEDLLRAATVAQLAQVISAHHKAPPAEDALAQALRRLGPM